MRVIVRECRYDTTWISSREGVLKACGKRKKVAVANK